MDRPFCLLFAGQSVQETGLCAELWRNAAARRVLERLSPILGDDLERATTVMPEAELALTYNAQRAIHAHHLGHWEAFRASHPGLRLDGAVGHSMGVVAALAAAGAMSLEDSARFIRARAEAFAAVCRGFDAPMGLAAASTEDLQDLIDELPAFPGVSLALHNTAGKGVLGGRLDALEGFARRAEEEGWPVRIKVLKVEGPYHTPAFAPAREALRRALEPLEVRPPRVPVFMGTSGRAEQDPARIRELLVAQADSVELHLQAVRAAYAHGCRRFLEVAHKPQPVTWLADQLVGPDGRPAQDARGFAVRTASIDQPLAEG